jgi:DNA-binding MarR family transcriptional regulator
MSKTRDELMGRLSNAFRQGQNLSDAFDDAIAKHYGLNRTDMRCLDVVDREAPVTAGRIASEAKLTSGAVTAVLDRLESRGFVRRVRDPDDRRKVLVETTDRQEELGKHWIPYSEMTAELLKPFDEDELRKLVEFFEASTVRSAEIVEGAIDLPPYEAT